MTSSEQHSDSDVDEPVESTEALRRQGAEDFMGPGFLDDVEQYNVKRRAYEFWYHPYTELVIFALIIISVLMLFVEISIPTGEPIGWMGGLAAGGVVGIFFWADAFITLIFVVEYVSKLWITPRGRKWFFVRNSWIELLALLPILRVFRLFRIFRAVRIFRLLRVLRSVRLLRASNMLTNILQGMGSDLRRQQAGNFIIIAYFFSAMAFGTLGVLIFERGAGSGLDTIGDGLWWCVVTLSTVGYGDIVPETSGGRIVASIVVIMGLGFWSLVTGVFTSTLVQRARRTRQMGLDILGIGGHIVVLGWNDNATRLVRDFRTRYPLRHVVIVSERDELNFPLHSRHHHICADPGDEDVFETVQIDDANTVVVLAERDDDTSIADITARCLMLCLKARKAAPQSRILLEVLAEQDISKARAAGADDIVVTDNYAGALISQSIRSPGLHRTYRDLFDVGCGSMFAERTFPDRCVDTPFNQAATRMFVDHSVSLVGIRRGEQLIIAPQENPTIRRNDRAVIIQPVSNRGGQRE